MTKYLLLSFTTLFLFIGCGSSQNLTLSKEYQKILREKNEFIAVIDPMAKVTINKNSFKTTTILPEAGNNILYSITIEEAQNIQSVFLSEQNNLNLSKILFKNKDYFYDSEKKELLLNLNIPYLYLIDNSIDLDILFIFEKEDKTISSYERKFNFKYKPMKANDEGFLSYEYLESISENPSIMHKKTIQNIEKEFLIIDKKRVTPDYRKKIESLENKI